MIGKFIDEIIERTKGDSAFAGFETIKAYEQTKIKYPIKKPYVTFSTETSKTSSGLVGTDEYEIFSEVMTVTVTTDEEHGGSFCENCAKNICMELMKLDKRKMITSISVGKCGYDKNVFGYRITMKFGLRETGIKYGGE